MRALVDMEESSIRELDALAQKENRSRASLIREAVADFIAKRASQASSDAFGLWADQRVDGLAYQEKVRGEW